MAETLKLNPIKNYFTDKQIIDGLKEAKDENQRRLMENLFYTMYVNYIYHVAINKCRNFNNPEDLAKDVTQETFINAFRALKNFLFPTDIVIEEHTNLVKAWLGKISNNCFRKIYSKLKGEISVEDDSVEIDDVFCPICCEILLVDEKALSCSKGHYKTERKAMIQVKSSSADLNSFDLFESLYQESDIEVPNEFRTKLQEVMNTLKEENKHILLTYVAEGCINSKRHLSKEAMSELCKAFDTSSENIRQIKKRTLDKIKNHCFPTNKK